MNNRFILILSFAMTISLVIFIFLQLYWVRGYYRALEQDFSNKVHSVLETTTKKIEGIENIKFNKKCYEIVEKIAVLIDNIPKDIINIENTEIIKQFKISCKEKNLEIIALLKEYDSFYIPKIEEDGDLLFKEVEFIKIEEDGLSDGEKIKLDYFSTLYSILNGEFKNRKYITLLFDEVEAFLHPEWSRIFLYELITELEEKYSEKKDKETKIENKEEVKIQNINVIF